MGQSRHCWPDIVRRRIPAMTVLFAFSILMLPFTVGLVLSSQLSTIVEIVVPFLSTLSM